MHFLCLHGFGTSSEVLERRTAPLRHLLSSSGWGGYHSYDFIGGSHLHASAEPSRCSPLASTTDTFHPYFIPFQPDTIVDAVRNLRGLLEEGVHDGVVAFSHGSCLLATLLLSPLSPLRDLNSRCRLKIAIFLSPVMVLDYQALERGQCEVFNGEARAERIEGLVTAHVYGKNDQVAASHGRSLWDLCKGPKERSVHEQGHAVPNEGRDFDDAVRCVRRAIEEVEGGFGFDQVGLGRG